MVLNPIHCDNFNDDIFKNLTHDKYEELNGKTGSMVHVMSHILQSYPPMMQMFLIAIEI